MSRHGKLDYFIDAGNEDTSSWLRWVNCSRHVKEENVRFFACLGKAFYVTLRDIHPGQELLVYYGDTYAKDELDIDVVNYSNMGVDINLYKNYACWAVK